MCPGEPGAGGLIFRFDHYNADNPRPSGSGSIAPQNFFYNDSDIQWGVQPVYAYDASRALPVPGDGGGYNETWDSKWGWGEEGTGHAEGSYLPLWNATKRSLAAPAKIAFFPWSR